MRGQLKNAVEDESATLEEHITPVPSVVLHNIVSFRFYPEVKSNE
jgi:hypothetical protein